MKSIYLGAAVRTPIGKFGGALRKHTAAELAAHALRACSVRATGVAADGVFLGHARQAGAGPNPARQATIAAGLPESVPAMTINQACASGLTAVFLAIEKIRASNARSIYAGGVESMSNTPYLLMEARFGYRLGNQEVIDGMRKDGFFCPMSQMLMGETVENYLAKELGISRAEQDAYALLSQKRADTAWKSGQFAREIVPIKDVLADDEHRRADTTLESLSKLPPVFDPKTGTITAGNSSGITDGAAFVHVSADRLPHSTLEVLDYETVAIDPRRMGIAPVPAIRNLLARQKLEPSALEAVEINEAFAAQVIACQRELKISPEKLNSWGGSIALGHPIGASGVRVLVTLDSRMYGKSGALGIAALCVSGGMGVALLVRAL